jgi:hypothetical protein
LSAEVLKREVLDGEKAGEARKKIARAANKTLRKGTKPRELISSREQDVAPDGNSNPESPIRTFNS